MLRGLSGQRHQIDVSVYGPKDLILIECKHREKESIRVEMVLTFFGRLYDIRQYLLCKRQFRQIHGVMVASRRFDSRAKKIALFYGIDLQSSNSISYFSMKYKDMVVLHPPSMAVALIPSVPSITIN